MKERSLNIDAARGLAVILMFVFHLAVDLEDFYGYQIGYGYGLWLVLNVFIAVLFIGISGWTVGAGLNKKPVKQGMIVLAAAALVSVATYFFNEINYVRFGILHLLGCALLLSPVFLRLNNVLLFLAVCLVLVGSVVFTGLSVTSSRLLPFGVMPEGFVSIDYYPLLPWLAIFILGLLGGRCLGVGNNPEPGRLVKGVGFFGRYALFLYLLHQPVFLLVLYVIVG